MPRARQREDGAALVEFALILPVLCLFVFGIIEFGLAYDEKQSINSAAREGARTAAIPDASNTYSNIEARVDAAFNGLLDDDIDTLTIEVVDPQTQGVIATFDDDGDGSPCDGNADHNVVVTATVEHVITIPFFGTRDVDLTGRGEFRCEIDV